MRFLAAGQIDARKTVAIELQSIALKGFAKCLVVGPQEVSKSVTYWG